MKNLSGGQKRRLQLLLILLAEPNVLILDEPTNDLDTDMLAAIEDLLDSWPGTLLVVSHDRYLIERVTDRQFAILDGHLRDLPRGVEQYLELRKARLAEPVEASVPAATPLPSTGSEGAGPTLAGADRRAAEKELSAIDRRLQKLGGEIARLHERLAVHDQSDYVGLGVLGDELDGLEASVAELETRWLEVSEALES